MKRITSILTATAIILGTAFTATAARKFNNENAQTDTRQVERQRRNQVDGDFMRGEFDGEARGKRGAEGRRGHRPGGPDQMGERLGQDFLIPFWTNKEVAEDLTLTEDQINTLTISLEATLNGLEASKGSVKDAHKNLRAALDTDNPDLNQVNALADEIANAANEKHKLILGHMVTVKTVLSQEQETALKEARKERFKKSFKRGGKSKGGSEMSKFGDLRGEIRDIIRDGGDVEDVEALLLEKGVPEEAMTRIIDNLRDRLANRPGFDASPNEIEEREGF